MTNQSQTESRRNSSSRKGVAFMWAKQLGSETCRVDNVFEQPVRYTDFPEFPRGLNQARIALFGEEVAKSFQIGNLEIPNDPALVVHRVTVKLDTGEWTSCPYTGTEAHALLEKSREELRRRREEYKNSQQDRPTAEEDSTEFGTSVMADALNRAKAEQQEAVNS